MAGARRLGTEAGTARCLERCAEAARTARAGLPASPLSPGGSGPGGRWCKDLTELFPAHCHLPRSPRGGSHQKAINPARRRRWRPRPRAGRPTPSPARPPGSTGPAPSHLPQSKGQNRSRKVGSHAVRAQPSPPALLLGGSEHTSKKAPSVDVRPFPALGAGPARADWGLGPPFQAGAGRGTRVASHGHRCSRSRLKRRGRDVWDQTRLRGGLGLRGMETARPGHRGAVRASHRRFGPSAGGLRGALPARRTCGVRMRGESRRPAREAGNVVGGRSPWAAGQGRVRPPAPPASRTSFDGGANIWEGAGVWGPAGRGWTSASWKRALRGPGRPPGGSDVAARGQWAAAPALERARGPIRRRPSGRRGYLWIRTDLSPQSPALGSARSSSGPPAPPPAPSSPSAPSPGSPGAGTRAPSRVWAEGPSSRRSGAKWGEGGCGVGVGRGGRAGG